MKLRIAKKVGRPGCFYTCATLQRALKRLKKAVKAQQRYLAWPLPTARERAKLIFSVEPGPMSEKVVQTINKLGTMLGPDKKWIEPLYSGEE